jgi:hypothetical protein
LDGSDFYVEGVAYFVDLEPGCVGDAMSRLGWLEQALADLNARFEATSGEFWGELERASDALVRELGGTQDPEEIIPVPSTYGSGSPKQRIAV